MARTLPIPAANDKLLTLQREIVACGQCSRLTAHCQEIATKKRRAYSDWTYWGKPVPSFGDSAARCVIVGLAPGAHGANRTGRMFTGDRSGEFLYRALYNAGFASQPESSNLDDGLRLTDAWITAAGHCAPPDNKPTADELRQCRPFLERELDCFKQARVVVTLGKIAFDTYLSVLKARGAVTSLSRFRFGHGALYPELQPVLLASYHPSQQNTSTGRLTQAMLDQIFKQAASIIQSGQVPVGSRR